MTLSIFRTLFIVALVGLGACGAADERDGPSRRARSRTGATETARIAPESAAVQFVRGFYSAYTPRGVASGLAAVDSLLKEQPQLFTPELLQALRRDAAARAAATGEIDGLDFEPFLNSQDPCARYEVGSAARAGGRVQVPVHAVCDGRRAAAATVVAEVVPANGGWAFANFVYGPPAGDLLHLLQRLHP